MTIFTERCAKMLTRNVICGENVATVAKSPHNIGNEGGMMSLQDLGGKVGHVGSVSDDSEESPPSPPGGLTN